MKQISLADVAKHSGVSKMTVSRVVNGVHAVKEDTRKRVEASVAALGYKPDPMMRILRTMYHRAPTEDARVTLAYLDWDADKFSLYMYEKATEAADAMGYSLKYFKLSSDSDEHQKLSHRLWMQGILGLIFGPVQRAHDISGFQVDKFAMVSIGEFHHSPTIDSVTTDFFQTLYLAASKCHEQGARRIALYVSPEREAYSGHRWLGAYHAFCQHHKLKPILPPASIRPRFQQNFPEWIRRQKIDAIIGLQGIRVLEKKLPEVFFACLNDWQATSDGGHVHVPREQIVKEAVSLLDHNLLRRRYGIPAWPRHISIEGKWRTTMAEE